MLYEVITEEMRASSASTSENTKRIDDMMGVILSKNESVNSGIADRVREIENAAANAKSIASLFEDLKAKSDQVAGITGSIQDVSDRTGILAINASIEAARAGAVGRGFRIIANEVRTLAIQTGDFAKQIETNVITSYSIHYTKLYDNATIILSGMVFSLFVSAALTVLSALSGKEINP